MAKKKSKEKSKTLIKPDQLRNALVLTGREYIETPEYKERGEQHLTAMIEQITPDLKRFQDFAKQANQRIASLGIPQAMKQLQEDYSRFLKNYVPRTIKAFDFPINYNRASFTDKDINIISEKSAKKVMGILNKKIEKLKKLFFFLLIMEIYIVNQKQHIVTN